jgi:tetratricopeptide (TPR) repeat protein
MRNARSIAALLLGPLVGLLVLALAVAPALADEAADKADLDHLFAQLTTAPDADAARVIEQRIWHHWLVPSDEKLASRMADVLTLHGAGELPTALVLLDKLVADYPTYAEAWNQKATIEYELHAFDASLASIQKVLQFEPRHFGALSGRVLIYLQQGKRDLALGSMIAALAIDPWLSERDLFPELVTGITRI